uniref:INCENP_ARK-bind domain-containing protein n=1 Tax=Trichuris muris TaxID=70415 RepID=A0A5S6QKP4_TRIMR
MSGPKKRRTLKMPMLASAMFHPEVEDVLVEVAERAAKYVDTKRNAAIRKAAGETNWRKKRPQPTRKVPQEEVKKIDHPNGLKTRSAVVESSTASREEMAITIDVTINWESRVEDIELVTALPLATDETLATNSTLDVVGANESAINSLLKLPSPSSSELNLHASMFDESTQNLVAESSIEQEFNGSKESLWAHSPSRTRSSDYEITVCGTSSDDDSSVSVSKPVPSWAQKEQLEKAFAAQRQNGDPKKIFAGSRVPMVYEDIFGPDQNYFPNESSAIWDSFKDTLPF